MDHMNLSDELRKQLLESAAWGKAGIKPQVTEDVDVEETEERVDEMYGGGMKGNPHGKKKHGKKHGKKHKEEKVK